MVDVSWRPPTLATERLILRALAPDDAADVFQYARNPRVARYTLWEPHGSLDESLEFITSYAMVNYQQAVPDPFAITQKGVGRVIGTVGCFWASREHRCMELGYALDEPMWGRGIATEAARATVDFVFRHFDVERVQARCKKENVGSARIMGKLGMRYEGTLRSAVFHQARFWDVEYHAVLRRDWQQ
jgi:ribosomal-protein-alanine N-acetyltransferase